LFEREKGVLLRDKKFKIKIEMKVALELPRITIVPQTEGELFFFQEMLHKMRANFVVSKTNDMLLSRLEEGLQEAKMMKEGKLPKKPLHELYSDN
jgi:hypothetical protein